MASNRSFLFFGLAVVLGIVTSIMAYNYFRSQTPPPAKVQAVKQFSGTQIAVASMDVPWGTPLTKEMIRLIAYPSESLPEGRFEDLQPLKGRVVLAHLKRNEPILESKLAPTTIKHGGVIGVMKPGNRAMAVRVNEIVGLPGFVKPGDRVDVMVTTTHPKKREQITKTVLENLLVLATGTQMERKGPGEKPKPVKVFTFEVSLEEAEKLALASISGKLRLALRSPLDSEPHLTRGATPSSLLASYQAGPKRVSVKRRPRSKRERVELITGIKKEILKF